MNIGQMVRGLLGDAVSSEPRTMELKIGQVVRGVVVGLLENNEAIVQINGVQVRAKLEAPMQAGQAAFLQVQPQSHGALVVLKSVDPALAGLPEDTIRDYARLLGLPNQRWAADLIRDLRAEGLPFNKEMANAFRQAASALPQGGSQEQWMQAAAAGFKRGLPLTAATVGALHQVMFGQEAHRLLDQLAQQLGSFVGKGEAGAAGTAGTAGMPAAAGQSAFESAAGRVLALLEQGSAMLRSPGEAAPGTAATGHSAGSSSAQGGPGQAAASGTPAPAANAAAAGLPGQALPANESGVSGAVDPRPMAAGSGASASGTASGGWLGQMMKWLGVDYEHQLAQATVPSPSAAPEAAEEGMRQGPAPGGAPASAPRDGEAAALPARPSGPSERPDAATQPPPSRNSEQRAAAAAVQLAAAEEAQVQSGQPQAAPGPAGTSAPQGGPETLKSALLTLLQAADAPAAIRDTAQQLVQQITGQQLLLAPERNSSMFTHVTLFIPFTDQDGGQTASVHIQTRRGRKGELDADNCRLLFDLSMKTIGETLVDVNIMDKIVSLNVWNDHPATPSLIEESRGELAGKLEQAGYQLLSLRSTPLPKDAEVRPAEEQGAKSSQPPEPASFAHSRYKGVDFRV